MFTIAFNRAAVPPPPAGGGGGGGGGWDCPAPKIIIDDAVSKQNERNAMAGCDCSSSKNSNTLHVVLLLGSAPRRTLVAA
jgi:hypothetical protein